MNGIEAAGDAITGAVIGRAIEPGHGEGAHQAHGNCANCGAALTGPFCASCGQMAHLHRTLGGIGHEILHGVFHFEGKIWRTLPLLIFKPGQLTRRYIHGERARFVSPMALFLFSVFLMFAIVSSIAGDFHSPEVATQDKGKSLQQLDAELKSGKAQMAALRQQKGALPKADPRREILDGQIDTIDKRIDGIDVARDGLKGSDWTFVGNSVDPNSFLGSLNLAMKKASKNPDLLIYKLQSSAYKYSWALIPLSTPFVWLLFFWRRDLKMYDHAIFITYSLAFMSLLVVTLTVLGAIGAPTAIIALSAMIIPPLHMYKQLKYAYLSGRVGALTRTAALMIFALIALIFFAMGLLFVGVLG